MPEAATAAISLGQLSIRTPCDAAYAVNDHLGDAVAPTDREGIPAMVYKDDLYLPTIICINRAGSVKQRNTVMDSQTASGPDLGLIPFGQRHGESRWDEHPVAREDNDVGPNGGADIHARRRCRHITGQCQIFMPGLSVDGNLKFFGKGFSRTVVHQDFFRHVLVGDG